MKKKQTTNYAGIFVSIFIALIMITSIMGYIFSDRQVTTMKYNGIKFTYSTSGWHFKYNNLNYVFSYFPTDLEKMNVSIPTSFTTMLEIDSTYDVNDSYKEDIAASIFELSTILSKSNIFLRQGFTTNTSYNFPIITCQDASSTVPVLFYKTSNQTIVTKQGNCIIIESESGSSFLAFSDIIAYKILGIME
jgi:hypothetical protein